MHSKMKVSELLKEYETLAQKLGIEVRYESLKGTKFYPGGYCLIKKDPKIIIEKTLSLQEKTGRFAEIFATLDLEGVYMLPALRDTIERYRKTSIP